MMRKLLVVLTVLMNLGVMAKEYETISQKDKNGYTYETVTNDPLGARIYTLENGLKVYLSVYKDEPRIQTYVAVKAGSKFDPADATGLAHYLEHIMFKGTSKIGTWNWEEESKLLSEIEELYQQYRQTDDEAERTKIYHKIDSVSGVAATYAIANEYDKLVGGIGATGTNAYTSFEQTVYINDIPANQIEKWATIESERFSEVVPRLFHTELEAVYEEKNMGMDNDNRKMYESLFSGLFPKHQYGTQTTIGTIDHLKNPSITEIKKYFNKYYVPNNMAICLSGDLNPEETIKIIDRTFGKMKAKSLPEFVPAKEEPIKNPIVKEVIGPDAASVNIGFRLPGLGDKESIIAEMMSMILYNDRAGLIDLNLNQQQKVMGAYSFPYRLNDYSMFILAGKPVSGEDLDDVKDLLLGEIENVKKGNFDDWLLEAIINDYLVSEMKELESNKNRANSFVKAFTSNLSWNEYIAQTDVLSQLTKSDVVDFANKYFSDNYVIVYKRTGEDNVVKVPKPEITPVNVNREQKSEFFMEVMSKETPEIQASFLDFDKDITRGSLSKEIEILYKENVENEIFNLYYMFDMGSLNDRKLAFAIRYLNYIGSEKYSADELKEEFYKLGCSFDVHTASDRIYVVLKGLNKNFEEATKLFEEFLKAPKADDEALAKLVSRTLKGREDRKLNKREILTKGMVSYAKYGENSQYKYILSEDELKSLKGQELVDLVKGLYQYKHRVNYYGPKSLPDLTLLLKKYHKTNKKLIDVPSEKVFEEKSYDKNIVYFVDYDMVQCEILFLSKSIDYNPEITPKVKLFNEYFGGSMGSIVFQEMRESKALAYSVRSYYKNASKANDPNYVISYIGTQSDKFHDAIKGMNELLNDMPESKLAFENAKEAIINTIETNRITKTNILFTYENSKKLGVNHDLRKDVYEYIPNATFAEIKKFQEEYVANQPQAILVIGSKDNISKEDLAKYGEVVELTLEDVFGY